MRNKVDIYDTTLRDGSQSPDISFSVDDKLAIAERLDWLGVDYIEGGWPALGNAKDRMFFRLARRLKLKRARLVAFGATRKVGEKASTSPFLQGVLSAETRDVCIVGKANDFHVTAVLKTSLDENLRMLFESIQFLKKRREKVFFDAEHYFDGFRRNPAYALQCLKAAYDAGADALVLCDTNGGSLPEQIADATDEARKAFPGAVLGIHVHNDGDLAVANTLVAVDRGVRHVQGTINGYGERCGNANLISIIPALTLKKERRYETIPERSLGRLTQVARFVANVANLPLNEHQPYVGGSAFAHKAGLHSDALIKAPGSYEHLDPARVGNTRRLLASEQAGKGAIVSKFKDFKLNARPEDARTVIAIVKQREADGYQYEGADASLELLIRRQLGRHRPAFKLLSYHVDVERRFELEPSEASVKLKVGDKVEFTVAEGNGPVNALDAALRKALLPHFPSLRGMELVDYKVRVLAGRPVAAGPDSAKSSGTGAKVRVLIESRDAKGSTWSTVGVHENIIEASWEALVDAVEYRLLKARR
jgi:2-isopropylmalate synthase